MSRLVVILISGQELTENLSRSLTSEDKHPWAFADWKRQMQSLKPGTNVAFINLVDSTGKQVNRFTSNNAVLTTQRIVLGLVGQGIHRSESPFFDGYPFEFTFDHITEKDFPEGLTLDQTVDWLNAQVNDLNLAEVQLPELIRHAKSNKIGVFIDGAPRKARYFQDPVPPESSTVGSPGKPGESETTVSVKTGHKASSPFYDAVTSFSEAVAKSNLVFTGVNSELPRAFLAALVAKRFAILSGLSGSGKTQIARSFGQWLGADKHGPRSLVVPVRPDWTSPEALLGYEDALLKPDGQRRSWAAPAPLRFMLRAAADPEHLYLLVLDEMNLAHVERYFADVLSGIESREPVLPALVQEDDGNWRIPEGQGLLPLPPNLLVVGTVNVDETTYQFSPKVLDRAFTFDFRVGTSELGQATKRPTDLTPAADHDLSEILRVILDDNWHHIHPAPRLDDVTEQLTDLHERLSQIGFEFGHRTFYEATRFAATLAGAGLVDSDEAFDWILMTKILPRLHGSRRQLEPFLGDLLAIATGTEAEKPPMPLTARKVARMLELVRANQFVSFAE